MHATTQLEPITATRAEELFRLVKAAEEDDNKAIALDEEGFATRIVDVDDPRQKHLLGDLDVHA